MYQRDNIISSEEEDVKHVSLETDLSRGISPYTNEIDTPYFYDILYYN